MPLEFESISHGKVAFGFFNIIPFTVDQEKDRIAIGEYVFTRGWFQELVRYVWLGGYPRWKDNLRPDDVLTMKEKIEESKNVLFDGLILN